MYTLIKKLLREGLLLEITIGDAWSKFYSDTTKFPALNGSIELFNKLNDLYPRNGDNFNKSYFNWLYSLLRNGKLKEEDFYKAKEYLGTFVKFYNRIPQEGRDINQYKSLPELYNVVKDYIGSDEPTSKSDEKRQIKNEEIEKVFEDEDFLIMIPKTERASCLIGKGTQWCTAAVVSNNMFNSYNDQGPLYVIIDKDNNNKYQLHFESNQLMDAEDRSIGGCYFFEEIVNDSVFDFLQTKYERFWDFILETSVEDIVDGGYCEMFTDALSSEVTPSVLSDVLSKLRGGNDSSAIYTGFVYEKDPNEIDNDDLVNLFDNEYIDPEDLEGIMSHLEAIKYDFENYEVSDNPVSKYREAMLGLSKNKLEIGINYQTDKGRELIINKINIFNPEKPYNITVNKETGNVDIETLVNYIHQGQLFESKSIIKKLLKKLFISEITIFENKLNKRFIKKLIRENLESHGIDSILNQVNYPPTAEPMGFTLREINSNLDCDCCKYFDMNSKNKYGGFEHPLYYIINKREINELEYMTPKQYIYAIARGFGISYEDAMAAAYQDEKAVKYAEMMKAGSKAPIGFYVDGKPNQEGRHRAVASMKLGCKMIPVIKIVNDLSNEYVHNFVDTYKDYSKEQMDIMLKEKGYDGISGLDWREFSNYVKYRL